MGKIEQTLCYKSNLSTLLEDGVLQLTKHTSSLLINGMTIGEIVLATEICSNATTCSDGAATRYQRNTDTDAREMEFCCIYYCYNATQMYFFQYCHTLKDTNVLPIKLFLNWQDFKEN